MTVQELAPDVLLVTGLEIGWTASAYQIAAEAHRRNGGGRAQRLAELCDVFADAARKAGAFELESVNVRQRAAPALSDLVDPIVPAEAAAVLDRTPQAVTAMCRGKTFASAVQIAGRGGPWFIEREEVHEWKQRRTSDPNGRQSR